MAETISIPFERALGEGVALHSIEWWRPDSRFVVLRYTRHGELQQYGKRLDIDKRAFLDLFENAGLDDHLRQLTGDVLSTVSEFRDRTGETRSTTLLGFS